MQNQNFLPCTQRNISPVLITFPHFKHHNVLFCVFTGIFSPHSWIIPIPIITANIPIPIHTTTKPTILVITLILFTTCIQSMCSTYYKIVPVESCLFLNYFDLFKFIFCECFINSFQYISP